MLEYPRRSHSKSSSSLAVKWLLDCVAHHQECRVQSQPAHWLPTRLLDVGPPWSRKQCQRILTSQLPSTPIPQSYVSLSHRWTEDGIVKLTSHNLEAMLQELDEDKLTDTFREAVEMTRLLGVLYIWIDSLCIIQDSISDWQAESSDMGKVYEYSICNIAATAASTDDTSGLYRWRDAASITPYRVHVRYRNHDASYVCFPGGQWSRRVTSAGLNMRGWVFQERLLSPRTLHCSSQLFWECRRLSVCETYPSALPRESVTLGQDVDQDFPSNMKKWRGGLEEQGVDFWDTAVQAYSRCSLTRPEDRLVAMAGIARQMQPVIQDEYLAGIWKQQLPHGLLWSLTNIVGREFVVKRPLQYRGIIHGP